MPDGREVTSPDDAAAACRELGGKCVVKAQIHAGGRGKAGGVKVCRSPEEAQAFAKELLGKTLVTHQTGPAGRVVQRLLAEALSDIETEFYLGIVLDRATGRPAMMASSEGGMEIEEVAAKSPEKILREVDRPRGRPTGLSGAPTRLRNRHPQSPRSTKPSSSCSRWPRPTSKPTDRSLEINPLVLTKQGDILALDAKIGFDDNALFRQKEIVELRDLAEEDPKKKFRRRSTT